MREKIKIPISEFILEEKDIRGLAECVDANEGEKEYIITFMNQQEIESDNIKIFDTERFKEYEIKNISELLILFHLNPF